MIVFLSSWSSIKNFPTLRTSTIVRNKRLKSIFHIQATPTASYIFCLSYEYLQWGVGFEILLWILPKIYFLLMIKLLYRKIYYRCRKRWIAIWDSKCRMLWTNFITIKMPQLFFETLPFPPKNSKLYTNT